MIGSRLPVYHAAWRGPACCPRSVSTVPAASSQPNLTLEETKSVDVGPVLLSPVDRLQGLHGGTP